MDNNILQKAETLLGEPLSYEEWWDLSREMWPDLVTEIKRLQAMNPFQVSVPTAIRISDNLFAYGNAEEMAKLQDMLMQLAAKDVELARWQNIAIEACALNKIYLNIIYDPDIDYNLCEENYVEEIVKSRTGAMKAQAAKELQLEATNEASYLIRLELAYTELKVCDEWDKTFGVGGAKEHIDRARDRAQSALAKIRAGGIEPKDCCP